MCRWWEGRVGLVGRASSRWGRFEHNLVSGLSTTCTLLGTDSEQCNSSRAEVGSSCLFGAGIGGISFWYL